MRVCSWGAVGEVTGSCHLVEAGDHRFVLDCGLLQGSREDEARNAEPFDFDINTLDGVVLSHAHIDHSGRLPLLVRRGFRGPIWTHPATIDLLDIMLRDAANLAEADAERARKYGRGRTEPLYDMRDVSRTLGLMRPVEYGQARQLAPGVELVLHDAGHILGAASVELREREDGRVRTLVYSGDLGSRGAPIIRDPARPPNADLVLLESTYGDRNHRSRDATFEEMQGVLDAAWSDGGNVLIPAFAVGRTQEVLYAFAIQREAWNMSRWQVFLDSPMAIRVLDVYERNVELFDAAARQAWTRWPHPFRQPNLHLTAEVEHSMAINRIRSGAIIIAGAGMCNGGRIRHHLRMHLGRRESHIVFVGYQARGTLGRRIVDGAGSVRMFGEEFQVRAQVHTVGGWSAHADQQELTEWYGGFASRPPVSVVHGEVEASRALATHLHERFGCQAHVAKRGAWLTV